MESIDGLMGMAALGGLIWAGVCLYARYRMMHGDDDPLLVQCFWLAVLVIVGSAPGVALAIKVMEGL